ncbi:MAG: hypothetical protein ACJAUP_003435 [Cellvibrionaceae bacterium]|jgi:hypothetical protein
MQFFGIINHSGIFDMSRQPNAESEQKIRFLCPKHRQKLLDNPEYAQTILVRLLSNARHKLDQGSWDNAALVYGSAFETAEILFEQSDCFYEVNRYLQSAIEFAYALRHCSYEADLGMLVALIEEKLNEKLYPAQIKLLLKPLRDMAFSPLSEIYFPIHRANLQTKTLTHTIH